MSSNLPEDLFWDTLERYSFLLKRQEEWDLAIKLWEQAAENSALYAHEELAKYYEHRSKNLDLAQKWTLAALEKLIENHMPAYEYQIWKERFDHRLARLQRRIANQME